MVITPKFANPKKQIDVHNAGNSNFGKQGHSTKEDETYSKADDQVLIRLKVANTPWKDILTELGKESKSQLVAHYKDLEGKGLVAKFKETHDATGSKNNNQKKDKSKSHQDKATNKVNAVEESHKQSKKQRKAERNAAADQAPDTPLTPITPGSEGGKRTKEKTEGEVTRAMRRFAYEYDNLKWVTVASRYYDLTGNRVDAQAAREMFD